MEVVKEFNLYLGVSEENKRKKGGKKRLNGLRRKKR